MAHARYAAEIEEAKKAGIPDDIIEEVINQRIEDARLLGHSDEEINSFLSGPQAAPPETQRPPFDFGFLGWGKKGREAGAKRFSEISQRVEKEGAGKVVKGLYRDVARGFAGGASVENLPQDYSKIEDPNAYNLGKSVGTVLPANLAFKGAGVLSKTPLVREGIAGAIYGMSEKPEEGSTRIEGAITNAIAWPVIGGALRMGFRVLGAAGLRKLFGMGQKGGVAEMPIVESEVAKETPRLMLPAPKSVIYVSPEGIAFPPAQGPLSPIKSTPKITSTVAPSATKLPKRAPTPGVADAIQEGGGTYQRSIHTKQGEIVFFTDPRTNKVHRMHVKHINKENVSAKLTPNLMGSKAPVGTAIPEEVPVLKELETTLKGTRSDKIANLSPKPDPKMMIESGGGKYVGVGEGLPGRGQLHYFNDPNGSTLAVFEDEMTPKLISEKLMTKKLEFEQAAKAQEAIKPSLKETLPPDLVTSATRKGGRPRSIVRAEGLTDPQARVVASKSLISKGIPAEEAIKQTSSMDILKVRDLAEKELSQFRVSQGMTTSKGGRIQVREPGMTGPRELKGMPVETTETEIIEKGLKRQYVALESLKDVPPSPAASLSKLRTLATEKGYELSADITGEKAIYKLVAPGGEVLSYPTLDDVAKVVGEVPRKALQPVELKGFDLKSGEPEVSPFEKTLRGQKLDEHDVALLQKQREFFEKTKNTLEGEITQPTVEEVARPPIELVGNQQAGNITGITMRDELLGLVDEIKAKGFKPVIMKAPGGYDLLYFRSDVSTKRFGELYYKMITKGPRSLESSEMQYLNRMTEQGGELPIDPTPQGPKVSLKESLRDVSPETRERLANFKKGGGSSGSSPENISRTTGLPPDMIFNPKVSKFGKENWLESVKELAQKFSQEGLERIPKEWIETVQWISSSPRRGATFYHPSSLMDTPKGQWITGLHSGGNIDIGSWGGSKDLLVHEVAHAGWYSHVPAPERAVFWEAFLKNPKTWFEAYGGIEWSKRVTQDLESLLEEGDKTSLRAVTQKYAGEIFAMAVAEKAARTTRGATHQGFNVPKEAIIYGKLSKDARDIIDKYVKTILLAIGGYYAANPEDKDAGAISRTSD